MSHTGARIAAPVSILGDLQPVLGTGLKALGAIIAQADINKFAKAKPFRSSVTAFASAAAREAACSTAHYGLSPRTVAKILRTSLGYSATYSDTEAACLAEIYEWDYARPRGIGNNEWFRQLDFDGYNHEAVASDGAWGNHGVTSAQVTTLRSASVSTSGSRANKNLAFTPSTTIGIFSNFSMQITDSSQGRWNWQQNMEIPIAAIDGGISGNNDWRLVLAVWLPTQGKWAFFPSRKNFYAILQESNMQNFFPDFATNPYAWSLIQAELGSTIKSYDCVPLIVQGMDFTTINGYFCPRAVQDATIAYCMPSGSKTMKVSISPSFVVYLTLSSTTGSGTITYTIRNSDTSNMHEAGCRLVIRTNGQVTSDTRQTYNVAAGGSVTVGPLPNNQTTVATLTLETQDGIPIS